MYSGRARRETLKLIANFFTTILIEVMIFITHFHLDKLIETGMLC